MKNWWMNEWMLFHRPSYGETEGVKTGVLDSADYFACMRRLTQEHRAPWALASGFIISKHLWDSSEFLEVL